MQIFSLRWSCLNPISLHDLDTCSIYLALHMIWYTTDCQDGRYLLELSPSTSHSISIKVWYASWTIEVFVVKSSSSQILTFSFLTDDTARLVHYIAYDKSRFPPDWSNRYWRTSKWCVNLLTYLLTYLLTHLLTYYLTYICVKSEMFYSIKQLFLYENIFEICFRNIFFCKFIDIYTRILFPIISWVTILDLVGHDEFWIIMIRWISKMKYNI